jgi:thiol-disulfide isomerase/thioredoxin
VRELGALLDGLAPGVRVVSLMSQCYSGAFARLSTERAPGDAPHPDVCGYFSSTAERPAYGCFPQNVGKEKVGYSFQFLRALGSTRRFAEAHAEVLVHDDTPDVPLRSSDVYLEVLLRRVASERAVKLEDLAARILSAPKGDSAAFGAEGALVERVGEAFGVPAPRSFAAVGGLLDALPELGRRFDTAAKAWRSALSDATSDDLQRFVAAHPAWVGRVDDPALARLDGPSARSLTASLLAELSPWALAEGGGLLGALHRKDDAADAAAYRTQVRIAAAMRMRTLLTTLAGRAYLERSGAPAERKAYEALLACEDVELPAGARPFEAPREGAGSGGVREAAGEPFPPLEDDRKLADALRPGWIGMGFEEVRPDLRKKEGLPDGASRVTAVVPSSPAWAGGLLPGDIVIGPPDAPFTAYRQVRSWTMLSPIDQPEALVVLRSENRLTLTLVPKPLPLELPRLPPPPQLSVGAAAPSFGAKPYRGAGVDLKDGRPHLLYFWETWCKPCKAALPEVLAFERDRKTQVVAVTDEGPDVLDPFFKTWKTPFPRTVVMDGDRKAYTEFSVTGTPTFILVDGKGIVRARTTGYVRPKGIGVDGWAWGGK